MEKSPTFNASVFDVFRADEEVDVAARIIRIVESPNFITKPYLKMLQRLSGENDIQFLEDIAFTNKKESEKEIELEFRIWPKNDRPELFSPFSSYLPNANWKPNNLQPWWFKYNGENWIGKAKHFCVVLLFIRRILSSDMKLMIRVWLDQLPYRLIPLKELKDSLRKVSSTKSNQELLNIIDTPPLLKQLSQQEREKDEAKQEKYAITIEKKKYMTGFAKQIVDQLARKEDGVYIDVSSGEKYEKYNDKIYIGGRKYYFQTWAEDKDILEKYNTISNILMQQNQSFVVDSDLDVGFDDEIKLILKSIDEIEGNNVYKEESFIKSVNHIIDNNVDTYPDVKIYHFGRITSKRDTDTIESMNEDNIWGYGSLLFALREYNYRSLSQEIAKKNPNLEKFNSDWASFIPGRIKDNTANAYKDYLKNLHETVSDAVLIILDYFLQFRKTVDTKTFEVTNRTKYDGQVVLEKGFDAFIDNISENVKNDRVHKKSMPPTITEYRAHVMNPLFDVMNNKAKINFVENSGEKKFTYTTEEQEWVKKIAKEIQDLKVEEAVAFFLLGYATIGNPQTYDRYFSNYQKPGEKPIYRSRLTKDGKDSKFSYTLYEGFLVNAYEQYKILEDIFFKLKDSNREDGKLTNRVVHYAKDSRNYKPYYAYIHKDESKLTLKNENESIDVFKMELYQQRLHGVAFDDPDETLEESKRINFDQLDDFWFMFSHLRRCTIYWYRVYSNLLALLYELQYDDVIDKYLEKYIYDNLEEGLLTKKEKRYVQNRNRFNINMTQEVFMDKVANIVQPLASTINDSFDQIKNDIKEMTKIVLVKQGTVDEAMEKLDWLKRQKELYDENQRQKEETRQEQLEMEVEVRYEYDENGVAQIDMVKSRNVTLLEIIKKLELSTEDPIKITATIDMDQENDTPISNEYSGSDDDDEDEYSSLDDEDVGSELRFESFTKVKENKESEVKEAFFTFEVKLIRGGKIKRTILIKRLSIPKINIAKCDDVELIISEYITSLLKEGERVGKFTSIVVDKTINATR